MHCYMDRKLFGKCYRHIHREMDKPYLILGKKHRVLFHDYYSALVIAEKWYPGELNARLSALFHIRLDEMCSSDPVLKANLEFLAEKRGGAKKGNAKWRKRTAEGSGKTGDPTKDFMRFLEKVKKFKDLAEEFFG